MSAGCPNRRRSAEIEGEGRRRAHLGEDGGGEPGEDAAAEIDREARRARERGALLVGHVAEHELVAELVHRELPDCVWDLSARRCQRRNWES